MVYECSSQEEAWARRQSAASRQEGSRPELKLPVSAGWLPGLIHDTFILRSSA